MVPIANTRLLHLCDIPCLFVAVNIDYGAYMPTLGCCIYVTSLACLWLVNIDYGAYMPTLGCCIYVISFF